MMPDLAISCTKDGNRACDVTRGEATACNVVRDGARACDITSYYISACDVMREVIRNRNISIEMLFGHSGNASSARGITGNRSSKPRRVALINSRREGPITN